MGDGYGRSPARVADSPEGVAKAKLARQLLSQGDWGRASAVYRELSTEFPHDKELRRHFLLNAFRQRDYYEVVQQSLDLADMALAENDTATALERYSEILRLPELAAGEQGQAAADEVSALIDPLKSDIYFSYGDHYLAIKNPQLALQYFDVSERLAPGRWETAWGAGQAWLLIGDKERAVKALYASVNAGPNEAATAYELLGEVLLGEGRPLPKLREMFWRASVIYENYDMLDDALRVALRWLKLDNQDRTMVDRATALNRAIDRR